MKAYLTLARPANVVTAWADITLGFVIANSISGYSLSFVDWLWLILATTGLYAGGIAFNDIFDAKIDAIERPERPIPSGQVSLISAYLFASTLLLIGVLSAMELSYTSGLIAFLTAFSALTYNLVSKHLHFIGPINMGLCRALNLLLGVSVAPVVLIDFWYIGIVPLIYIAGITSISKKEVSGGNFATGWTGIVSISGVIFATILLSYTTRFSFFTCLPFLLFFLFKTLPPLYKMLRDSKPENIKNCVKTGVISLIILNATLIAGFANILYGIVLLALLPLSQLLSKKFAVT